MSYKLPFERCVCFVFLIIILVFLSCSGFRIDSLVPQHHRQRATTMSDEVPHIYSYPSSLFTTPSYSSFSSSLSSSSASINKNNIISNNASYSNRISSDIFLRRLKRNLPSSLPDVPQIERLKERRMKGLRRSRDRTRPKPSDMGQEHQQNFSAIEHHHQQQQHQLHQQHHPFGRIETLVIPPPFPLSQRTQRSPSQLPNTGSIGSSSNSGFAQISPPNSTNKKKNNKNKRQKPQQRPNGGGGGNNNNNNNNHSRAYHCQRQDVARKAYLANTVVRAKAESMSSDRVHNYSVTFRILERYKTSLSIDDTLRLTFSSDTKDMNCDFEGRRRPHDLVKAQIQQSKEYFLFLNSRGMHNYSVVGMPVLKKRRHNGKKNKDLEDIRRVTGKNFVLKPTKEPKIRSNRIEDLKPGKKVRLMCNVKGFPVPYVSWRKLGRDGQLHSNRRMRITYKKKRTTLVINSVQVEDEGVYQCVAKGLDGTITQAEIRVRISNRNECQDQRYKKDFCLNGGTCVRIMHVREIGCQCPDGFTGERCEEKDVSNHSSMYGHNTFSCKLGLSTTYYC